MLVKVLDENRVKILMEDQDVEFYDLPFEKINDEEPQVRSFLYDLIQKTHEETGVNLKNCRLMVEVIPGVSRSYYILITRMPGDGTEKLEFDKIDRTDSEMYLFKINDGAGVLRFFDYLKNFRPAKSELYYYQHCYYAALAFRPYQTARADFSSFIMQLEEFGGRCRYHSANEATLREWGELLLGPNAVDEL